MIEIADDPCVWVKKIGADGRAVMVLDHENIARVHLRMRARSGRPPGWRRENTATGAKGHQGLVSGYRVPSPASYPGGLPPERTGISRARKEGVEQETTYVKLNIGAPMSQGVVEVKRIREYIRAHGGYQVDPVASPNWVLMPDGSTRSARRHEVAIYTFLVPQNERKKIAHHIKQEGYHVLDVLPDE